MHGQNAVTGLFPAFYVLPQNRALAEEMYRKAVANGRFFDGGGGSDEDEFGYFFRFGEAFPDTHRYEIRSGFPARPDLHHGG